jgi:hypothetical protein
MFLCALGNSVPENSLSQLDCFEVLKQHHAYEALSARGKEIVKVVLTGDNGITDRLASFEAPMPAAFMPMLSLQAILYLQLSIDS